MIESLVGNSTAEKILLYITNYGEGYISGIAETFKISKSQVRKQLLRFENGGILVARDKGSLRLYTFNPRSKGISTVLTGGAVVSIYTENKYMSYDADFISPADQKSISKAMQELGFEQHGKRNDRVKATSYHSPQIWALYLWGMI